MRILKEISKEFFFKQVLQDGDGGPGQTRTADLTIISRAL